MSDCVTRTVVRRATVDDYDAVMCIVENVVGADGVDYIPATYHDFLHDKQHVNYVAETSDSHKVVHFLTCRLLPVGTNLDTAILMGARTLSDFQGRGIYHAAKQQILHDFPSISRFLLTRFIESHSVAGFDRSTVYCEWNSLRYDIDESSLQTLVPSSASPSSSALAAAVRRLSHLDCAELVKSGNCQQFLGRFASEFVPTAYVCVPVRLDSEGDLTEMMTRFSENTLVTYASDCVTTDRSVCGLSCSVSLPLMTRYWRGSVYFHVQYFGDELDDAVKHLTAQLCHVATAHRDRCILLRFCFPVCIDSTTAARRITSLIHSGLDLLLSERVYLVSVGVDNYREANCDVAC